MSVYKQWIGELRLFRFLLIAICNLEILLSEAVQIFGNGIYKSDPVAQSAYSVSQIKTCYTVYKCAT